MRVTSRARAPKKYLETLMDKFDLSILMMFHGASVGGRYNHVHYHYYGILLALNENSTDFFSCDIGKAIYTPDAEIKRWKHAEINACIRQMPGPVMPQGTTMFSEFDIKNILERIRKMKKEDSYA